VTLAVTSNTTSGQVVRRQRMPCFEVALIAVDRKSIDIRRLSGRGKTPTFCVFPVFSVAVMEKCCDACGDGKYYYRSICLLSADAGVSKALIGVDRRSMGHTVAERS
jgi:hypothetical protein